MPEELDPTTARLVSELAAQILPALTKSLTSAIPIADFSEMLEKNSRMSQELSLQVEKAIQSIAEESKTSQNIMSKSLGNIHNEISSLKHSIEDSLEAENELGGGNIIMRSIENILDEISGLRTVLERRSAANIDIKDIDILSEIKRSLEVRPSVEKAIQSGIDDNKAGRSIIAQSIGNVLEEISNLKRMIDRLPGNLELAVKNNKTETISMNKNDNSSKDEEIMHELSGISHKLEELTSGIKYFFETYAGNHETHTYEIRDTPILTNDAQLDKIINTSLPNLEGLVKAESKSRHHELEEFSREISTLQEQNNIAMINDVKEAVAQELTKHDEKKLADNQTGSEGKKIIKLLRLSMMISGAGMFLVIITILLLIMK